MWISLASVVAVACKCTSRLSEQGALPEHCASCVGAARRCGGGPVAVHVLTVSAERHKDGAAWESGSPGGDVLCDVCCRVTSLAVLQQVLPARGCIGRCTRPAMCLRAAGLTLLLHARLVWCGLLLCKQWIHLLTRFPAQQPVLARQVAWALLWMPGCAQVWLCGVDGGSFVLCSCICIIGIKAVF